MKRKILKLTVGIPAYNEEQNIKNLLYTVLKQTHNSYILEKIIVISDGSTDSTNSIVTGMMKRDKRIVLIAGKQRKGKTERLNELLKINKSDILTILDADIILDKKNVFNKIIQIFNHKNEVALIGLNMKALSSKKFIGKLINTWEEIWYEIRIKNNNGINIYNIRGGAFALRTNFINQIKIPNNLQQVARYVYHYVQSKNYKFVFAKNATTLYRAPDNLKDYVSVLSRGDRIETAIFAHEFGANIFKHYQTPGLLKMKIILKMLLKKPFLVILAFIFNSYAYLLADKKNSLEKPGIWEITQSTKKVITINF